MRPPDPRDDGLFGAGEPTPNLSPRVLEYLANLDIDPEAPDGRGLTVAEARKFTALAQRLTGVVMLEPALDENY